MPLLRGVLIHILKRVERKSQDSFYGGGSYFRNFVKRHLRYCWNKT